MLPHTEQESDESLRDRLCEVIPPGAWYTAEDIGNASGKDLDALAATYGVERMGRS